MVCVLPFYQHRTCPQPEASGGFERGRRLGRRPELLACDEEWAGPRGSDRLNPPGSRPGALPTLSHLAVTALRPPLEQLHTCRVAAPRRLPRRGLSWATRPSTFNLRPRRLGDLPESLVGRREKPGRRDRAGVGKALEPAKTELDFECLPCRSGRLFSRCGKLCAKSVVPPVETYAGGLSRKLNQCAQELGMTTNSIFHLAPPKG